MTTKPESNTLKGVILSTSENEKKIFRCIGRWKITDSSTIASDILTIINQSMQDDSAIIDLSGITEVDTLGAICIVRLQRNYKGTIELQGISPHIEQLMSIIPHDLDEYNKRSSFSPNVSLTKICMSVGKKVFLFIDNFCNQLYVFGLIISNIRELFLNRYRSKEFFLSLIKQIHYMGVSGAPVIILISFVTGAVIAQQGAFQLAHFGAEIFAIDLMSILQLREIGVLLTAVMVAGRSGSAIAAEISVMKINEELDAIKVMGIDLVRVLISPRIWALIISLPLLTILANFSAIIGASIVVWKYYDISFFVFFSRFHATATLANVFTGLIKAPFMACAIGIIAFKEGLKVGFNADSLGTKVTNCVVQSISMVIIIDSLFAMFYFAIGI
ncbi:MAG: ABC transporter permease [Candidatus Liberibacter ctenarytainae]|uniref:ABC transporter permease n=1 Tax=Candidatus Liberibacter ctenarytainae TaxID=2020335 RepID=A0A937ALR7_9HYPH|nr:ABC transporter permease [Candidatus Liberibacter ctenarytainae]